MSSRRFLKKQGSGYEAPWERRTLRLRHLYCPGHEPAEGIVSSKCIKEAGFLKDRKQGRWTHYRLDDSDFFRRFLLMSVLERIPKEAVAGDGNRLDDFLQSKTSEGNVVAIQNKRSCCGENKWLRQCFYAQAIPAEVRCWRLCQSIRQRSDRALQRGAYCSRCQQQAVMVMKESGIDISGQKSER